MEKVENNEANGIIAANVERVVTIWPTFGRPSAAMRTSAWIW